MQHSFVVKVLGPLLFLAGVVIRYKISERRFNRRSITGIEIFPTHRNSVTTRVREGCAGLLAKIFIFLGIIFILAQWT